MDDPLGERGAVQLYKCTCIEGSVESLLDSYITKKGRLPFKVLFEIDFPLQTERSRISFIEL